MEKIRIHYYRIFQLSCGILQNAYEPSCEILHMNLVNAYKQKDSLRHIYAI